MKKQMEMICVTFEGEWYEDDDRTMNMAQKWGWLWRWWCLWWSYDAYDDIGNCDDDDEEGLIDEPSNGDAFVMILIMLMELSVTKVIISATVACEIYIGARYVSVCHKTHYLMMMILIMMTMIMMIMMRMDSLRNLHINSWRVENKNGKSVANEA